MTLSDWLYIHALIGLIVGIGAGAGLSPELPFGVGFVLGFFWPLCLSWIIIRDVAMFTIRAVWPPSNGE